MKAVRENIRCLILLFGILGVFLFVPANAAKAEDDTAPATYGQEEGKKNSFSTGTSFFDKAELSGSLVYFQRKRLRENIDSGRMDTNLNHATSQANMDFRSGFAGGVLGVDFAAFGGYDLWSSGAPEDRKSVV